MFIRSKDGKHLTKVNTVDLETNKILVNGVVFGEYPDEASAEAAFRNLCQECCDMETFFDLRREITEEEEEWDDDEDDSEIEMRNGVIIRLPKE